ncbi:hypothetical protein EHS11_11555 [Leptospira ilyithenensis]|uniref:Porin n=1 Tax=Leptospira ilyithenensis TaxID=2484901 RepID=A0A4R9LS48_9LEPT|nr:hypothetical protein EHS11_11555 [Leptospira ilyithenensis]
MKNFISQKTSFTLLVISILQIHSLRAQETVKQIKDENPPARIKELYIDEATGQLFSTPGANRRKVVLENQDYTVKVPEPTSGFANRPEEPVNEKLTISGRVQFRGITGQSGSVYANGKDDYSAVDWNFRRLRLGFIYEGNKWWGGFANLRLENAMSNSFLRVTKDSASGNVKDVSLANSRGIIQEAGIWLNIPFMKTRVTFGTVHVPFQREYMMTSANLTNIERSMSTLTLPQFDTGVSITSHLLKPINEKWERLLTGHFMVGNGHGGTGDYGYGRRADLADERPNAPKLLSPAYYGRLQWNPLGGLEKDGKDLGWIEGEEIFQRDTKLSIGTAFASMQNVKVPSPFNPDYYPAGMAQPSLLAYQTTRDGGDPGTAYGDQTLNKTSPSRPKLGMVAHTYDFTFTTHGFYTNGAYSVFTGSAAPQHEKGYQFTFGYVIPLGGGKFIMPITRFDYFQADLNWNKNLEPGEAFRSYWVGLNLFGDKHVFKAQIFYQVFNDKLHKTAITGESIDIRDNVFYFQLQANFWTGTMTPDRFSRLE